MLEGLLRPQHLLLILIVAIFVFGGKKLPEIGKGLGDGIRHFRDAIKSSSSGSDENDKKNDGGT